VSLGYAPSNRAESIRKLSIPAAFRDMLRRMEESRADPQEVAKSFTSLLFSYCLLPRMLNSPSDALYCARFTLKCIRENEIPSNLAIKLIFWLVERAVDHVKFSTENEVARCIPVFVNDLLRLFRYWNAPETIAKYLAEVNLRKWNESRQEKLKGFI
jgi:hypothetical protein